MGNKKKNHKELYDEVRNCIKQISADVTIPDMSKFITLENVIGTMNGDNVGDVGLGGSSGCVHTLGCCIGVEFNVGGHRFRYRKDMNHKSLRNQYISGMNIIKFDYCPRCGTKIHSVDIEFQDTTEEEWSQEVIL